MPSLAEIFQSRLPSRLIPARCHSNGLARTGHQSLKEVERYTRDARRAKLADSAAAKLTSGTKSVPLSRRGADQQDTGAEKLNENKAIIGHLALPRGTRKT